jgi:NAD(P)-dependent dehydrogenase (short-subunit alcohol dehydrogenase family)
MNTVLITGANRGIGLALAEAFVQRGDRVIAAVRDPFRVPDFLKTAPREQMILIGMDVADARSVERAAASVKEPIDVVINNAGISGHRADSTLDMDIEDFLNTLSVNTLGPLRVARAFLPHLRQSERGRILNISTQMASLTYASAFKSDRMAYRASKTALNKVMQGMATDLKADNIAVALAHPGWVKTDMGGQAADLKVAESAAGLLKLIDSLTLDHTGQFFRWDGTIHPW